MPPCSLQVHRALSPRPGHQGARVSLEWALTVQSEAGVAGVVVRTAVGVSLVHGFIHHGRHPDGQVGGECEHEATPVRGRRAEVTESLWLMSGPQQAGELRLYWEMVLRSKKTGKPPCEQRR